MLYQNRLRLSAVALGALMMLSCKTGGGGESASDTLAGGDGGDNEAAADAFYKIDHVIKVDITMNDWDTLRYQKPKHRDGQPWKCDFNYIGPRYDWFHAQKVTIDGVSFDDVGAKKRSFCNSYSEDKPALGLSLDKFKPEQKKAAMRAFGADSLTLGNSLQDPSFVRQCLSYKLFNDAGIKSPRCNFVHVKVNGRDLGLYVNIEPLKKPFLKRHFGEPLGNLYEAAGQRFEEWAFAELKGGLDTFKNDESLNDVRNVMNAVKNDWSPDLNTLAQYVDIEQVIKYWAMEIVLIHWDGFARGSNNAYFYFAGDGKLRMIPWGVDQTFTNWTIGTDPQDMYVDKALYRNGNNLIKKLYDTPKYNGSMRWWVNHYLDTVFKEDQVLAQVDAMGAVIAPYRNNDTGWSTELLKRLIRERRSSIRTFIGSSNNGSGNGGSAAGGDSNGEGNICSSRVDRSNAKLCKPEDPQWYCVEYSPGKWCAFQR